MSKNLRINMKHNMGFRLFRAFVVVLVVVLAVYTTFSVLRENREAKENLSRKGEMLTGLLAYYSRSGVFAENVDLLKISAESIEIQKDVLQVSIYNAGLKPLYTFNKIPPEKQVGEDIRLREIDLGDLASAQSLKVIESGNAFIFMKPVILETFKHKEEFLYFNDKISPGSEKIIGYVKIVLSKSSYRSEMLSIFFNNIMISFIFFLSSIVVIYITVKKFTKPLANLTEHVRLFGTGESIEKATVESMDEIGKLAESFNVMVENLRKREEELRHAQKKEALGTLASGIAHDFNNILATVQGIVYILKKKLGEDSSIKHYIEQIQNSLIKLQNLIKGLLAFSRTQVINLNPVDINKIIKKLMPMLKNLAGDKVEIQTSLSEDLLTTMADELQIEQVFMNLSTNARDAMPEGGVLSIKTASVIIDEEYVREHPSLKIKPGMYALISVRDVGMGIDSSIKDKIFEPFFTTKESGKGIGLGLSIVYGIIEQHKGYIDVDTEQGKGTEFKIFLPLIEKNEPN